MDIRNDVAAIDHYGRVFRGAEGRVENGAVLRDVDFFAGEHGLRAGAKAGLFSQLDEEFQGLIRYAVFGEVEEEAGGLRGKARPAGGVDGEEIAEVEITHFGVVEFEGLPGRALGERYGVGLHRFLLSSIAVL